MTGVGGIFISFRLVQENGRRVSGDPMSLLE